MVKRKEAPPAIEEKEFRSVEEIDAAIRRFERRIQELQRLDVRASRLTHDGTLDSAASNVKATVREVFGPNSPEFREHQYLRLWAGPEFINMTDGAIIDGIKAGVVHTVGILNGLIGRLQEKREDLAGGIVPAPSSYFDRLNLHPRILEASRDLFLDGHQWEAVFAAAKTLVNYVKDRSGRHELDGVPLMQTVFSANNPILAFNNLVDQTRPGRTNWNDAFVRGSRPSYPKPRWTFLPRRYGTTSRRVHLVLKPTRLSCTRGEGPKDALRQATKRDFAPDSG
jgi:uncharacterized protein (TIGR02391 family)